MRKQAKRIAAGFMAASLMVVGMTTGGLAKAADKTIGSAGALSDSEYSLEEMLVYAIEDEYQAQTEYNVIMKEYGTQRPFSNIIQSEATHINLLLPLLKVYDVAVPENDWNSMVAAPESLEAAYAMGVEAEEKNIEMYESFLKEELPEDIKEVFERLMSASENHLRAFQNAVSGNCTGDSLKNGKINNSGQCRGQGNGRNRSNTKGSCLLQ